MTNQEIIGMFSMRLNGYSLREIGDHYGVTHERIRQILESSVKAPKIDRGCKCIYPGLKTWFITSGTSAHRMHKEVGIGKGVTPLYNRLSGEQQFTLQEIKRILAYTGLTFEEAFGEEDEKSDERA